MEEVSRFFEERLEGDSGKIVEASCEHTCELVNTLDLEVTIAGST